MTMVERKKFTPVPGERYFNRGGGAYECIGELEKFGAVMMNVASSWTMDVHGCGIYPDGTIDWDHSTGGYFPEGRPKYG